MSELARIFLGNQRNQSPTGIRMPMINSVTSSFSSYLSSVGQIAKKKSLMNWAKGIPELTALASKVARDVVSKYHFETVNPNEKGRNKILKANRFALENSLKKVHFSQVFDALITGEAFGWKAGLSKEQIKEAIASTLKKEILFHSKKEEAIDAIYDSLVRGSKNFRNGFYLEKKAEQGIVDTNFSDEDILRPRKYRYLASSTVEVEHDQYDIIGYNQVVGTNVNKFKPEEIVRFTLTEVDGRVSGFTPVESIVVQLELLRQMWQNMLSIHKNGGAPDKLFILNNTKINTPEYQRIEEQLNKYKLVENKHGNMVFTGEVTVEDLTQLDKMQFMDSGLYITGLVAMQWQIPRSSIPYIVGGVNTKDDTGGNSDASYWSTVEYMQEVFAEIYNTQLWIPHFGVKIVFDNTHIQKELRLETNKQMKLGNVQTTQSLLMNAGKQLKEVALLKLLDLTDADIEEVKMDFANPNASTMNNQPTKAQANGDVASGNVASRQRNSQAANVMRTGSPPNGSGKEVKEYFDFIQED